MYLVDVRNSEVRPLTSTPELEGPPYWSPDGAWIYFARGPTVFDVEIHRAPSSGGPSVRVTKGGGGLPSHDGRSIFVLRPVPGSANALWQVPLDGGRERRVAERVLWGSIAVGRRTVYFAAFDAPFSPAFVGEVEIATGRQRRLATLGSRQATGVALSPDERTLVVSAINAVGADLMVVEPQP